MDRNSDQINKNMFVSSISLVKILFYNHVLLTIIDFYGLMEIDLVEY